MATKGSTKTIRNTSRSGGDSPDIRRYYYGHRSSVRKERLREEQATMDQQQHYGSNNNIIRMTGPQQMKRGGALPPSGGVGSAKLVVRGVSQGTGVIESSSRSHGQRITTGNGIALISSPHRQRPSTPSDFPLIFGGDATAADGGSVNTGTSQQELLRKKARSESKKRQKRFVGGKKKKREPKIVNMPPSLVFSDRSRSANAKDRIGGKAESKSQHHLETGGNNKSTSSLGRHSLGWMVNSRASIDEKESLTAESTVTDSNSSSKPFDLPYSSVPLPPVVVNSEEGAPATSPSQWVEDEHLERKDETCSIDEYSFPLLSTNAMGGVSEQRSVASASANRQSIEEEAPETVADEEPTTLSRNVRFSAKLEHSTVFLKDEHALPNNNANLQRPQHNSDVSPSSVLDHPANNLRKPPKSILRDSKYKCLLPNRAAHARDPAFIRYYLDNANAALEAANHGMQVAKRNQQGRDYVSDQRSKLEGPPPFLDDTGSEVSPIYRSDYSIDYERVEEEHLSANSSSQKSQPYEHHQQQEKQSSTQSTDVSRLSVLVPLLVFACTYKSFFLTE